MMLITSVYGNISTKTQRIGQMIATIQNKPDYVKTKLKRLSSLMIAFFALYIISNNLATFRVHTVEICCHNILTT